jgi:predicted NBD/HSP70 family sugar kinase
VSREYEIDPEPEPDVAAAIIDAVERLAAEQGWDEPPGGASSAWRVQARREAVDEGLA